MERRQHRRVPAQLKSLLLGNSHEVEGVTLDLSIGGARIESEIDVFPGKQIRVRLVVPGQEEPLLIDQALVRWVDEDTFGIQFLTVDQEERDDLEDLIDAFDELEEGGHA
jgi:PilZ domain-containing protein